METWTSIYMENHLDENLVQATITDINWERILMHLTVEIDFCDSSIKLEDLEFHLVVDKRRSNGIFKILSIRGNQMQLEMNITNPGYKRCIPNGLYYIYICDDLRILGQPTISKKLAPLLPIKSMLFKHNATMGYNVNFSVSEDAVPHLAMQMQDMRQKGIDSWRKEMDILDNGEPAKSTFGEKTKKKLMPSSKLKHDIIRSYYQRGLKKYKGQKSEKKTVLFLSEQSETFGLNMIHVINRMKERGLDKQFNILTSARNMVGQGGYGKRSWLHVMDLLAQADIMIVDDHVPFMDWLMVDSHTTIMQIWHAGAGYKSVGYSRWGHEGSPTAFSCHRQYDYGITPSTDIAFFFSEQFGINEEDILPTGMPRMDEFLDPVHRKMITEGIYEKYPNLKGKNVILFAPTYRGTNRGEAFYPYELIDFDRLYQYCEESDSVVLFKMHPWVNEPVPIQEAQKDRFLDMNKYPNINDLFYISDLLITDYSSSVFEFSLMRKPMLFFAFDEWQYAYSRGFHREYRPACPGKIVATFDDLMDAIEKQDFEFEKNASYIDYHYDHIDTNATDRVIDWLILGQMPQEIIDKKERRIRENERLMRLDFRCLNSEAEEGNLS